MTYQREYEKKLKVGVVGVGSHCYRNLLPTMNFLPVKVVGLCDVDLELARVTGEQYGVTNCYASSNQMYENEELDAVFLSVSPQLHPELTIEALDAGLHVWVEKPPAMRAGQVEEMIRHRGEKVVVVGLKKAFTPSIRKVVEIFSQPKYLPLKTILCQYNMSIPANGAETLDSDQLDNWLANGIHPLSAMMAVGGPVQAVTVHRASHGGGACILEFAGGAIGNLHLGDGAPSPYERYEFYGTECVVSVENCLQVKLHRGTPIEYGKTTTYAPEGTDSGTIVWEPQNCLATLENKALFTQGMYGEMRYFCDCVLRGEPAQLGSLEFAHEVMKVYEAALLSDAQRVEVT